MKKIAFPSLLLLALPTLAHAHTGHADPGGLSHGLLHPVGGLDHILAMVAIGLWAVQLGGRALWLVPAAFLATLLVGGALGIENFALPLVEPGILASVLILGLLITFAARVPLLATVPLVGAFGVFHGFAHGAEMPMAISSLAYSVGFLIASAGLIVTGMGVAIGLQSAARASLIRPIGATIAAIGTAFIFI